MQYGTTIRNSKRELTKISKRQPNYAESGNSLKDSNIKKNKLKIHAAGKKDAGNEKILIFFTWPNNKVLFGHMHFPNFTIFHTQLQYFV
jgi:hypothetical protein